VEILRSGDVTLTVDPEHGGRLSSFVVGGHELLRAQEDGDADDPTSWGCFPMVPWAGRIRRGRFVAEGRTVQLPVDHPPHAIHGTAKTRAWTGDGGGRFSCDLGPDWPWRGQVSQMLDLEPDRLTMTLTVDAEDTMPVSAGWHPWFRRRVAGVDAELGLPAERMWQRDGEGIPDGTLVEPTAGPWDDCFTALVGPVLIRWPGVLDLVIDSDCEHVVVFTEPEDSLCVEPQSAPPDAHNSGEDVTIVAAGTSWAVTTTWVWRVHPG
jgi:aldose 1-epimerase